MKRLLIISTMLLLLVPIGAQTSEEPTKSDCAEYWSSNWFVEMSVGGEILFAPNADVRPFGRRISPAINVTAGKWLTPFIGARLQIKGFQMLDGRNAYGVYLADPNTGNTMFGNNDPVRDYVTINPNGNYYPNYYYQNTHLDLMVSVMNLVYGGYDPERHWDVIPTVGMGYMTIFPYKGTPAAHLMTSNFGVQGKYRITENWDVNVSAQYSVFSALFNSRFVGKKYAGNLELTAGVTYNIFGHKFDQHRRRGGSAPVKEKILTREVIKMVYDTIRMTDTVRIVETDGRALAAPKVVRDTVVRVDTVKVVSEEVSDVNFVNKSLGYVLFNIGADRPTEAIELQCINTANYLKENPESTITLYGYGDKETGSAEANMKISQLRIEAVKRILVEQYGISADRIHLKAMGCQSQIYDQPVLNRLVVIKVD